jgi:hypothetical protein
MDPNFVTLDLCGAGEIIKAAEPLVEYSGRPVFALPGAVPAYRDLVPGTAVSAVFDEPNLIADAGLLPLIRLAEQAGLPHLAASAIRIEGADNSGGAHPAAKVMSLIGAMRAGADSIDDAARLRHGAMGRAFHAVRAPSTAAPPSPQRPPTGRHRRNVPGPAIPTNPVGLKNTNRRRS